MEYFNKYWRFLLVLSHFYIQETETGASYVIVSQVNTCKHKNGNLLYRCSLGTEDWEGQCEYLCSSNDGCVGYYLFSSMKNCYIVPSTKICPLQTTPFLGDVATSIEELVPGGHTGSCHRKEKEASTANVLTTTSTTVTTIAATKGVLTLRADTGAGEAGCSNEQSNPYYSSNEPTAESCHSFCNTRFISYHLSKHCSCFSQCDFRRPAGDYSSDAKIYEMTEIPNAYLKKEKHYCKPKSGSYGTLNDAVDNCNKNPECWAISHDGCNVDGSYSLCLESSSQKESHQYNPSCLYVREDGCTSNATCTADQACIGTKRSECQDICHIKECAHFAECIAKDHSATCKCFAGYSGDPEGESCLPMIDCQWSKWIKEGGCSRTCGSGIQKFVRSKTVHEDNGGKCDGNNTKEDQCNLKECPDESANVGAAVGIAFGVLALLVGMVVGLFLSYKWYQKKQNETQKTTSVPFQPMKEKNQAKRAVDKNTKDGKNEQCKPIGIKDFLTDSPFEPQHAEYTELKNIDEILHGFRYETRVAKNNTSLNRYTNILPYDANRVQLNEAINGTDYINASWISKGTPPGARMPNACTGASFIAAQGPTVKTSPSYLQMIYENKVDIIVMLTNFIEQTKTGVKEKCEKYWPDVNSQSKRYAHMRVNNLKEIKTSTDMVERTLEVANLTKDTEEAHKIFHFHYTGWPDFGAPTQTGSIISLEKEVRRKLAQLRKKDSTILVHCSAGVGRSGTFIALYQIMTELEEIAKYTRPEITGKPGDWEEHYSSQTIDVFNTVLKLRSKRPQMVQSFAQYKYLFACVSSYAKEVRDKLKPDEDDTYVPTEYHNRAFESSDDEYVV